MTFSIFEDPGKSIIIIAAALILILIGSAMTYEFIQLDKEGVACISDPLQYKEIQMNENNFKEQYACSCEKGALNSVWVTNESFR